jgi:hypothetical protein
MWDQKRGGKELPAMFASFIEVVTRGNNNNKKN